MTNDLEKRIEKHNAGEGGKYTRSFRPVELIWSEKFRTGSRARKREAEIKSWAKQDKEKFIKAARRHVISTVTK